MLHMIISCDEFFLLVSRYLSSWPWLYLELVIIRGICVSQTHLVFPETCITHYQGLLCHKVSEAVFEYIRWSNKLFNDHEPWHLCKDPTNDRHVNCLLHVTMETLRVCSILLQPLIPDIAGQVLDRLGICEGDRLIEHCDVKRQSHREKDHPLKLHKKHIMSRIQWMFINQQQQQ